MCLSRRRLDLRAAPALLALTGLIVPGCLLAQAAEPTAGRALLIGINDYAVPSIPDLRGAVNDVQLISRILETRFGFERRNIKLLTDGQATRRAILDAIEELAAQAGEGDRVYFHYSGHGSQVRDHNGDEDDGLDETIVAHDSRSAGIPDITDDEFESRFRRLRARHALLVFDSCHSGTVTRSASQIRPRTIPPDTRTELYEAATRAAVVVGNLPHVLMTGAPADEQALDGPIDEGGFYGLFTYALSRSLEAHGPDASPQLVHEAVKQELNRIQEQWHMRPPEPQLEAPAEMMQQPLFGRPVGPQENYTRRAWLETRPIDDSRVLLVESHRLHAQPGSQWALYAPGEVRFDYGAALAVGSVESVSARDAVLRIDVRRESVPPGARAIAIAPPDISGAVPVRITGIPPERRAALLDAIQNYIAVKTAGEGDFYRFLVENRGTTWHVIDAGGLRELVSFADGPDEAVAARLGGIIRRSSRVMALMALDNLASDLKLWVGVQTAARVSKSSEPPRGIVLVSDDPAPGYRIRRQGEPRSHDNSLVIEIQTDRPAYITIVDVDAEGGVQQLFPNPRQRPGFLPDGRVPGGELVRIPDSLAPGNGAGFYWDYAPPVGRDTVRVFAAADLETAQTIRRFAAEAPADSRALAGLRAELATRAIRGIRISTDEAPATTAQAAKPGNAQATHAMDGDWSAASVVIDVRE